MTRQAPDVPGSPDLARATPLAEAGHALDHDLAATFNQSCFCITLDRAALASAMRSETGDDAFFETHVASRPYLFSNVPVFLPDTDRAAMMAIVSAIEATALTQAYKDTVLAWAPETSRRDFGPLGALMGYDFHLGSGPPRLIEINTNAGGAFLNAHGARAQQACCDAVEAWKRAPATGLFDRSIIDMFEAEWRRQRGSGRPRRIAILDDAPEAQYLYPEFVLAQRMLEAHGIEAVIADPAQLSYAEGKLVVADKVIDLVYNRLVDFALTEPRNAALRLAYLEGCVVVTPNPHNHALLADKRNLTVLSDTERLRGWNIPESTLQTLSSLPRSVNVTPGKAEELWTNRKRLFFKPVSGHGGKAVYRGDKLTKSVWAAILEADYIAQDLAAPGERQVLIEGALQAMKMDVRLYTYDGTLLLAAARLYQGQTTNFRTEGGGFAPVFFI